MIATSQYGRVGSTTMMAVLMQYGWRFATSRIGPAALLGAALLGWHFLDKSQAVKAARDGYVLQVELSEAKAELAELRRRAGVAADANRVLREKVQATEGAALRFSLELEAYENETSINPDGVVSADLLRRLRSN